MNARYPGVFRRNAEELAEEFDEAVAAAARFQAADIRIKAAAGDSALLDRLYDDLCDRLTMPNIGATLIQAAISSGPTVAGQLLIDLIQKSIDQEAENEAIKEVEAKQQQAHDRYIDDRIEQAKFSQDYA